MASRRDVFHCSHWGAYVVTVEGNAIVGVRPFAHDPAPSALIHAVPDWISSPRRIRSPMVRRGWLDRRHRSDTTRRGTDDFVEVDWDTAIGLVADEISRVRFEHGNRSIFAGSYGWASSGRFNHPATLLRRMLNLVGGFTGHVDSYSVAAGSVILKRLLGNDDAFYGRSTSLRNVLEHAGTVLAFGGLPLHSAQIEAGGIGRHLLGDTLREMSARGVRLVNVSPDRGDLEATPDAQWIAIRPNTDVALILGLIHTIVSRDLHDREFLRTHCTGAEKFLDYVMGRSDGIARSADWAASISGVPAEAIVALALQLCARRSFITMTWSLQRAEHGEQPYWAAVALASVIGHIGLPGGGFGMAYGSLGGVGLGYPRTRSPAMSQGRKAIPSFIPVSRISDMLLNPGSEFVYDGAVHRYPDTRLVYWAGGNPFHHHQDLNRLCRAWQKPQTIVVQDPLWTPAARRADIVLPATTSLERDDIAGNKRCEFLFAMQQAVDPVALARNDYDIFRDLSHRLGCEAEFTEGRSAFEWIEHLYGTTANDAAVRLQHQMPGFEEFWKAGHAELPVDRERIYLADFRRDPLAHPLPVPSGRIALFSDEIAALHYDDCPGHPAWIEPREWLGASAARRFPYHLISRQPESRLHSQLDFGRVSQASKVNGRECVHIHPYDALDAGIEEGDAVRLFNDRGQCLASALLDARVMRGVLILPTGAWYEPSNDPEQGGMDLRGNPNVLTSDRPSSRLGQGCAAQSCLVAIERMPAL